MPTLSVPTIKVNNDVVAIVPNSFKYKTGAGDVKVRAASAGGGNAVAVHSQDAETMIGSCEFKLYNTIDKTELISDWQALVGSNTVEALQRGINGEKDFVLPFRHMSVVTDPDIEASADGSILVQMAGDKVE